MLFLLALFENRFFLFIVDQRTRFVLRMNKNGTNNVNNNPNNTKEIKFHLNKSVQVTKIFAKEDHRLTKNEPIFTMVDTEHPGRSSECHTEDLFVV